MYREEYPRPQFVRKEWLNLNGTWDFDFDDSNQAIDEHWERDCHTLARQIQVPYCFESELSGIKDTSMHDRCFYKRDFSVPNEWKGKKILLNFGAVDYYCKVFVNEKMCCEHLGGSVGFETDITSYLDATKENQTLAVFVLDPAKDESISRGKQYWKEQSEGIWYTRTSGIWQTVWLEPVERTYLSHLKMTPDIDYGELSLEAEFCGDLQDASLEVTILFKDELICRDSYSLDSNTVFKRSLHIIGDKIFNSAEHGGSRNWTPYNPALYDITLKLRSGGLVTDEVQSYFGMRKIHTENGVTYLNNHPYYLKLVLDQGYWPEGILTAPSDEAFQYDIKIMKEMGFNGCRKHQKTEDPRFLYWADRLGFLVWGEIGASCLFTDQSCISRMKEWTELLRRDYNHPSLVAWVPFNESWGIPIIKNDKAQQSHTLSIYYQIKSLDPTRLVINNDGWELTKTDICAIHNYSHGNEQDTQKREFFLRFLNDKAVLLSSCSAGRNVFADGFSYEGQPILLTECGGINYNQVQKNGWGYTSAGSEEEFLAQYRFVIQSILQSDHIFGFCYTQLSDVEQETNGLLTYDRKPKCDPSKIREINHSFRHNIVI